MNTVKKNVAAACMAAVIIAGNSMTAFAAPFLMSDGTVFDAEYYAQQNPDVAQVYGTGAAALYSHYQSYGKAEGREAAAADAVPVGPAAPEMQTPQSQTENTQTPQSQTENTQTQQSQTEKTQSQQTKTEQEKTEQTETKASDQVEDEATRYFADTVFIGDSIMVGFRNYSADKTNFLQDVQFLAVGSYSAGNALKPVEGTNVHPKYKGKKYQVWDAVRLMDSKRAFVQLGMNDIALLGLEGARDAYREVLEKIEEECPGIDINIISVTYTLEGEGKSKLNNTNIAKYNALLKEMAQENGWGYIDLCTPVSDGKGNLGKGYCSDGFVHLSKSAYTRWEKELVKYAKLHLPEEEESEAAAEPETEKTVTSKTKS